MFRKNLQKLKQLKQKRLSNSGHFNNRRVSDKVFIKGLTVKAIVGIFDSERISKQRVIIDLDMSWNNRPAAKSQDINDALDYKVVSEAVEQLIVDAQFLLLETMAEDIATLLKEQFGVAGVRIRVSKPDAFYAIDGVGIEIVRGHFL